jgi:hypothetical protein
MSPKVFRRCWTLVEPTCQLRRLFFSHEGELRETRLRADFGRKYSDYVQHAEEMLSSHSVSGYKTIRDKLISHNELRFSRGSSTGSDFYDVKDAKLKYGDERKLLETLHLLVNHLLQISGTSISAGTRFSGTKKKSH